MARLNRHAARHAAKPDPAAPRCAAEIRSGEPCRQQAVAWIVGADGAVTGYCEAHALRVVTGRMR